MKKLNLLLAILLMPFVFTACDKDDHDDIINGLSGTAWEFTGKMNYDVYLDEDGTVTEENRVMDPFTCIVVFPRSGGVYVRGANVGETFSSEKITIKKTADGCELTYFVSETRSQTNMSSIRSKKHVLTLHHTGDNDAVLEWDGTISIEQTITAPENHLYKGVARYTGNFPGKRIPIEDLEMREYKGEIE